MKRSVYKILALFLAITLQNCGAKSDAKHDEPAANSNDAYIEVTQDQFEKGNMKLGSLEKREFPITVKTNGLIDVPPENKVIVSATMGGYIKSTPLLIGDKVKKGQLLITLENPEFVRLQQNYLEVKQQLGYLKSEFDRQQTLKNENITSDKSFLKAESDYKTAMATHNGMRKQLSMLNISLPQVEAGNFTSVVAIYAPISGSITKINVSKGTYVSPASPILEIIDNGHIHLELTVFEKDILKVKKGQPILFRIPEASQETFKAEVHLVGTAIGEDRTIKVHGHIEDEEKTNYLPGMFVEAEIQVDSLQALALPSQAITTIDADAYALFLEKEENGTRYFKQLEVTPSFTTDAYIGLKNVEGLKENQFLVKGAFDLLGE